MKNTYRNYSRLLFLITITLFFGCKKESNVDSSTSVSDKITFAIHLDGIQEQLDLSASTNPMTKRASGDLESATAINESELYYSTSFEKETSTDRDLKRNMANKIGAKPLGNNVIYRFILLESNGSNYVYRAHKDLTRTASYNTASFDIFKGKSYKWIAYSYNTNQLITDVINASNISIQTPVDKDLLYATSATDILVPKDNSTNVPQVKVNILFKHRLARLAVTVRANDFPATMPQFNVQLASTSQGYFKSGTLNLVTNQISNVSNSTVTTLPFVSLDSDSSRVAYMYTADFSNPLSDLTLRVNSVQLKDIYTYRDFNYPIISNRDFIIKAKSGVIPQPGTSYTPRLNFLNNDGVRFGNLIWARGNLTYNPTSGVYRINKTPNGVVVNAENDYWMYNSLRPWDTHIIDDASHRGAIWSSSNDPCRQVPGGWRLPTQAEVLAMGGRDTPNQNRRQADNWDNDSPVKWASPRPLVDVPQNSYTSFKGDDGQWLTFFKSAIMNTSYNRTVSTWNLTLDDSVFLGVSDGNAATGSSYNFMQIDGEQNYFKFNNRGLHRKIPVRCVRPHTP